MSRPFRYRGHASVAYTGTSANGAVPGGSREVLLAATTNCFVRFGTTDAVTATTSDILIPAGQRYHFEVPAGTTHIAAIQQSAGGSLSIVAVG